MILLNTRVGIFFSSSNEMLKKSNGGEYWKLSEVLDFTVNFSDEEKDEQPGSSEKIFLTDNLNDLFISNNFLRVKNKTTNFAFSEDELKKTKNVISFVSISSFCIPKVFRFLKAKENISFDETNAIFELGNLLERRIPDEGTIIVPFKEKKLLMDFIIRLFYCVRSYTPESVCLNVSSLENDLKVSFSIQQNSWNFISKSNSEKIRYLCLLNQILDRKHREYHINKTSIENLIIYGDEIYNEVIMQSENMLRNENTRTTGSLRRNGSSNRSGFIRQTGSLERNSSVRKRLSLLFKNSADRQKIFSSETFNENEPEQDLDKEKLIEALKRFHDLINHEEIDWFLHYNASMNNFDLTTATNIKKFPEFFKIINYFVDYGTSGFSIDLQSDSIYILKKTEIEREMRLLKVEYDLESIKSYFSVDILNEENEKKIFGSLLLSMASYFNVKHSQCVYDCLILLRRYIEGNLTNKENLDRKEVVNVILRSIEINRKRRRYFGRLIHNKLSEMMKE
ncbi:hypothetical protein NBO_80g0036 [Nosema bombycis CQ1]|uniref:Uncharacterized protein n=1 Tax=Nosema bombycis (strain CQ1 / CVCC 102059) TaxID=578461 RepID=R0MKT1_NOSB1|nr:hypothetical protein NBO_80g0036 [Nosema bombycis CQ1]|eukprot:EOB13373.1 hypothetical protein NBO_80g0036 [Nosema bombycis CQ1]